LAYTRKSIYHFNFEKVTGLTVVMSKMNILVLLSMNTALALKLQQSPEFDMEGSIYDEECGDRYNYKCWKKGGHSLDKEEAAYITTIAWGPQFAADACLSSNTNLPAAAAARTCGGGGGCTCIPQVLVTFNKEVQVSKCDVDDGQAQDTVPHIKINIGGGTGGAAARSTEARCNTGDLTRTLTFLGEDITQRVIGVELGDCYVNPIQNDGGGTVTDADLAVCDNGNDPTDDTDNSIACKATDDDATTATACEWAIPTPVADTLTIGIAAITVDAAKTIKNAGKSKNVNVANSAAQGCAGTQQPCALHTVVQGGA